MGTEGRLMRLGIVGFFLVVLVGILGIVVQHMQFTSEWNRTAKVCVSSGGAWQQNPAGNFECRRA
jgi:hypothetical protein